MSLMIRFCIFLVCSFSGFAFASLTSRIPLNIWQTYKTKNLPGPAVDVQKSWIELNPEFSLYLFDDDDIENYIAQKWPYLFLDFFHALPIGAMKADLWRYLILATEGGVYSDIDSMCLQPIRDWPFSEKDAKGHILLLDLDSNQEHFCQWTLAATPKHPAMFHVCHYVLYEWMRRGFPRTKDGVIDVLKSTGPAIFTKALKSYIHEAEETSAFTIAKRYKRDKKYRRSLNRLGVFLAPKDFFRGVGTKNLFWGSSQSLGEEYNSWGKEVEETQFK